MESENSRSRLSQVAHLLGRLALGWFFVLVGWSKVVSEWKDGLGSFYRSDTFQGRAPGWLPELIAMPYGYALPWAELVLGALLMLGLFTRWAAGLVTFLLLTIAIALLGTGELFPRHHVLIFFPLGLILWQAGADRLTLDAVIRGRK